MSDKLVLDFPVLQQGCCDFVEEVSYEVTAERDSKKLKIFHTVKGKSFIRKLINDGEAKFSVLLFYRDSAERQSHTCETSSIDIKDSEIVATQIIDIDFSYAPEIRPSIILSKRKKIIVEDSSGLTDFWGQVTHFDLPQYSRIAVGQKLKFTSGDISKLMAVKPDEKLGDGEVKVDVNDCAGEGETPVTLLCGKDVFQELRQIMPADPGNAVESMRSAIITSALCAVYAYVREKNATDKNYEVSGVLATHLEKLESDTGENWENEEFSPSLAATKMYPYAIKSLHSEEDYA